MRDFYGSSNGVITCYSAFDIWRTAAHPRGRGISVFCHFTFWPMFYLCRYPDVCIVVLYWIVIYRNSSALNISVIELVLSDQVTIKNHWGYPFWWTSVNFYNLDLCLSHSVIHVHSIAILIHCLTFDLKGLLFYKYYKHRRAGYFPMMIVYFWYYTQWQTESKHQLLIFKHHPFLDIMFLKYICHSFLFHMGIHLVRISLFSKLLK